MKPKLIIFLMVVAFVAACNETANNSTSEKDSTMTLDPNNSTVSPGLPDTGTSHSQDSAMTHIDSTNLNKR